jgi:hypothetical protein
MKKPACPVLPGTIAPKARQAAAVGVVWAVAGAAWAGEDADAALPVVDAVWEAAADAVWAVGSPNRSPDVIPRKLPFVYILSECFFIMMY